ncbi:hypothetical protein HY771_01860 [Candidatus Uhrbacteria bacterium]|nr:hypothetical protein [Candidatus Uhrbacteria bacterium]
MMQIGPELRSAITAHSDADTLLGEARHLGMRTLRESGLEKIRSGLTSLDDFVKN